MELKVIAKVESEFTGKFGIPRQSGIIPSCARIIFEPEYRSREAVRGLEGYSHIWVLWQFLGFEAEGWSPTVRPPRLGGNTRVGVFATRSPNRPNPVGLSSVKLDKIEYGKQGPVLYISGGDILNGTPVFDIKPYLAYTDSHSDATGGFSDEVADYNAEVEIPSEIAGEVPEDKLDNIKSILRHDPRPSYKRAESKSYGFEYGGYEIKFTAVDTKIRVTDIKKIK